MSKIETKDIHLILNQTTYTLDEACIKLQKHDGNPILVIKEYMGLLKENQQKSEKTQKIKSVNQEIYKQIRHEMDTSMRNYNNKHPVDIDHVIENFQESEKRINDK